MDLIAALRTKMNSLDEGDYTPGLKATIRHIETAFGHLGRGQSKQEETAFTDAIYRTNLAFEGSIKEAYRVLAGKDPSKQRPYDIEKYLEQKDVFRKRVLDLFKNYRTEWRNPSTHDYKLDFDESEAFLAIVSVSAFTCILLDQIAENVSYQKAKKAADSQKAEFKKLIPRSQQNLVDRVSDLLSMFAKQQQIVNPGKQRRLEVQVIGALAGFLASAAPDIKAVIEQPLTLESRERADLVLSDATDQVIVEIKKTPESSKIPFNAISQVENYLRLSGIRNGILFFYSDEAVKVERTDISSVKEGHVIKMLRPINEKVQQSDARVRKAAP